MVEIDHSPLELCLLSNDRYSVLLTASGGGYSIVDGMDVTRWREDATRDCWGQYCYIRDLDDDSIWSAGASLPGAARTSTRRNFGRTAASCAGAMAT